MYKSLCKPILDYFVAYSLGIVLLPIVLLVSLLIKLDSAGPVFYLQRRLGKGGKIITIYKFRTMQNRPDRIPGEAGELSNDFHEITSLGRLLRRFKIDETPQVINIMQGNMSLVGPRPCLPELQERFDEYGKKRILVKPGCTGLAQVHGNIQLSWPERWKYDAYYVENLSFILDMKILLKTISVIFFGESKRTRQFDEFSEL